MPKLHVLKVFVGENGRGGNPLGAFYGSDSPILDRRLADAPEDYPPGYSADLSTLHRLITEGPRSLGMGMRLGSLRAKYREEYGELKAEARARESFCRGEGA